MNGQQSNTHSRRANYSYIEEQNEARTELLNSKVNQLKHLAVQMGEETKYQNKYLKELNDNMENTNSLVGQARRRVMLLARSGSWKIYFYLFLFALFVFLVIYFLIKR
jgi:predicted RNA-binding protein with EMAP domain